MMICCMKEYKAKHSCTNENNDKDPKIKQQKTKDHYKKEHKDGGSYEEGKI